MPSTTRAQAKLMPMKMPPYARVAVARGVVDGLEAADEAVGRPARARRTPPTSAARPASRPSTLTNRQQSRRGRRQRIARDRAGGAWSAQQRREPSARAGAAGAHRETWPAPGRARGERGRRRRF